MMTDAQCARGGPSIRSVIRTRHESTARRARQNQPADEKKPATGFRPWLVFNCVLLQQSIKFD
jgi:hypothetical protein